MVFRLLRIPRAVNTPLVMLAAVILGLAFPGSTAQAQCGGEGQTPCKIWERVPSCNSGMKEDFGQGKCVKMATPCGAVGERPCLITERIPSCNPGAYEDFGKNVCAGLGDQLRDGFQKCVHVPGMSKDNGVQLRTWNCINFAHMTWEKVPMDKEDQCSTRPWNSMDSSSCLNDVEVAAVAAGYQFFRLKNRFTGKCAAVHAGQKDDGSAVVQWDCGIEKNYQWAWDAHDRLRNRESGMCLHSESGGHNVALTISSCPDLDVPKGTQWTFENNPGRLKNGFGRCLRVPEAGTYKQLTTHSCSAWNEILWTKEKVTTGDQAYFWFKHPMSLKCAAADSYAVRGLDCAGEPQGQNFHWTWGDGGQLVNRQSGKCLRVLEIYANHIGDSAIIETCVASAPSNNEKWVFLRPGGETYRKE